MTNKYDDSPSLYSGLTSPTVKVSGRDDEGLGATVPYNFADPKTRIYRGQDQGEAALPPDDFMGDPPVGCVLLVQGPGRGAMLKLGYGRNSIGRDANERVCLNFGDDQISRTGHAEIICDPKTRKFFAQGTPQARNLAYLGEEPLLALAQLKDGDVLTVGDTQLKFFAFVGPDWAWEAPKP